MPLSLLFPWKSSLSDVNVAVPALFTLKFSWYIILCPFTFNLHVTVFEVCMPLGLYMSCRQHVADHAF